MKINPEILEPEKFTKNSYPKTPGISPYTGRLWECKRGQIRCVSVRKSESESVINSNNKVGRRLI